MNCCMEDGVIRSRQRAAGPPRWLQARASHLAFTAQPALSHMKEFCPLRLGGEQPISSRTIVREAWTLWGDPAFRSTVRLRTVHSSFVPLNTIQYNTGSIKTAIRKTPIP
jgi:hypothetical protein